MNHYIHPAYDRMVAEWKRMYEANTDQSWQEKFAGLYKFMCDLGEWWDEKEFFTYKQEKTINKLYYAFQLHLENGEGKMLTRV